MTSMVFYKFLYPVLKALTARQIQENSFPQQFLCCELFKICGKKKLLWAFTFNEKYTFAWILKHVCTIIFMTF